MGQIVLWDKFSHKGNKSLVALLDFISNTGEYIIMVCHTPKVVDQMFSRVWVHIARKSPPTLPHPPGVGKRGTTPCKRYNTFKISGFTDKWGIRERFRLLATADPITTNLTKKTLKWPVSLNTLDLKRKHQQLQFRQCKSCVNLPGIWRSSQR